MEENINIYIYTHTHTHTLSELPAFRPKPSWKSPNGHLFALRYSDLSSEVFQAVRSLADLIVKKGRQRFSCIGLG